MGEEQGLSAENRALWERLLPTGAPNYIVTAMSAVTLNRLLDAARAEGLQPPVGEWQDIASAPKDGTPIRVQTYEVLRWLAYKPDGARQMKRAGRWQKHDGFGFTNCPDPHGLWQPADACQKSGGEA